MEEASANSNLISTARVAGWAVYLAMSWTWCIGMYLPVLIMRELGFLGVITFAVPNIVGAMAMGWILRDKKQSQGIIEKNRTAFVWYSLITIAFHAFFAAWIIRQIIGPHAGAAVAGVFLFFWIVLHWRRGGEFLATSLTLVACAALIGWGFWRHELPYVAHPVLGTSISPMNNLWLAPAWTLGFLCCPWLDLTFHAARQAMGRAEARAAFLVGFCIIFAAMLLVTVAYSGWLVVGFDRTRYPQLAMILGGYLTVQSCLTAALHRQQIARTHDKIPMRRFLGFSALLVISVMLGVLSDGSNTYNGMAVGELIYRGFLGFYGLIFPAYVWLRMMKPRRSMARVLAVIVIAAPMYWLAFADEEMGFAVIGVLIVVAGKYFPWGGVGEVRMPSRRDAAEPGA
ncbi:MAG TPA: hypothetical protein VGG44_07955 [Tepidisphaeraceae bacterium]